MELGVIIAFEPHQKKKTRFTLAGGVLLVGPFLGIRRYFFFSPPLSAKEKFLSSAAPKKKRRRRRKKSDLNKSKTHKTHHHVQQFPKSKQTSTMRERERAHPPGGTPARVAKSFLTSVRYQSVVTSNPKEQRVNCYLSKHTADTCPVIG